MLNLNSIMIGSAHPKTLADFYTKVLGKPDWEGEGWYGWQKGSTHLTIGEHSEVHGKAKEPQRVILNFESKQPKAQYQRIKEHGAQVVKDLYQMEGMWIATFADPDGNYFQVMSPWKEEK